MKQWNKIFKKHGRVFLKPQKDIPKIVKLFKKKGVKKVLDLGCGSGRHIVYLAKHGFEVYGIDIAPKGIRITQSWLKKEKLSSNLKVNNIYKKLPYPNNFFDALISTQALHHNKIRNIRKLIKEIERILKPKGFIFITVSKKGSIKEIPKEKLWKIKFIAPRTFVPLSHEEKGLIHYWFNKKLLRKEFNNFKIYDIWVNSDGRHYCFLGELKTVKSIH
ncbi:class I SAM-dependent methyltransferase [Patescibacteria group bacterium]|nr:class I SAM-dependent methyltransferase [Patescibacteria group bacterium]